MQADPAKDPPVSFHSAGLVVRQSWKDWILITLRM